MVQKQKNVVLILTDQLRKDCIGAYGNPYVRTPNLDQLAAESIRCECSYVANPICCPNRMSLFTGCMPSNHGLWTNGLLGSRSERTLPSYLRSVGYQTANIGKIHFNPYSRESEGLSFESEANWSEIPEKDGYTDGYFGFDYLELTIGHTLARSHYYKWFLENGGTDDMFDVKLYGPVYSPDERCGVRKMPSNLSSTEFVGERAVNYLRNVRDENQPFFLSVSFPDPHHPFTSCEDDYLSWKDRELGEQLMPLGMLVTLDSIFNRVIQNWKEGKTTWIFADEFYLLFRYEYSANFFYRLYKRIRKYNGFVTGLTQNVEELLKSDTARLMLANSEFLILLNQATTDRDELASLLNISENQLSYITNVGAGKGLIRCSGNLVPFENSFPKNTKLYRLMTTKPGEC